MIFIKNSNIIKSGTEDPSHCKNIHPNLFIWINLFYTDNVYTIVKWMITIQNLNSFIIGFFKVGLGRRIACQVVRNHLMTVPGIEEKLGAR